MKAREQDKQVKNVNEKHKVTMPKEVIGERPMVGKAVISVECKLSSTKQRSHSKS